MGLDPRDLPTYVDTGKERFPLLELAKKVILSILCCSEMSPPDFSPSEVCFSPSLVHCKQRSGFGVILLGAPAGEVQ